MIGRKGMGLVAMAAMASASMFDEPGIRGSLLERPSRAMRAPAPSGGRTYSSNGKREMERRRRKLESA